MPDDPNPRKAAVIAAVILSMFALLYLGGLLGQMGANYQAWLSNGGLTGNQTMTPPDFSPLHCVPRAFNADGRKAVLRAYERRLEQEITHPHFGYRVTYRRAMEVQARLLAGCLLGDITEYTPFVTR